MKPTVPHLYKVSQTQWACSPSVKDKHILRCVFGDSFRNAYLAWEMKVHMVWNRGQTITPPFKIDVVEYWDNNGFHSMKSNK